MGGGERGQREGRCPGQRGFWVLRGPSPVSGAVPVNVRPALCSRSQGQTITQGFCEYTLSQRA